MARKSKSKSPKKLIKLDLVSKRAKMFFSLRLDLTTKRSVISYSKIMRMQVISQSKVLDLSQSEKHKDQEDHRKTRIWTLRTMANTQTKIALSVA